jgi:hypothetical protein
VDYDENSFEGYLESQYAQYSTPQTLSGKDVNERFGLSLNPDWSYSPEAVDRAIRLKGNREKRDAIMDQLDPFSAMTAGLAGGIAGSMAGPADIALAFTPIKWGQWLHAAGTALAGTKAARSVPIVAKLAHKGAEAGVQIGVLEKRMSPIQRGMLSGGLTGAAYSAVLWHHHDNFTGGEFGWEDAGLNILAGVGLGAGGGVFQKWMARKGLRSLNQGYGELTGGAMDHLSTGQGHPLGPDVHAAVTENIQRAEGFRQQFKELIEKGRQTLGATAVDEGKLGEDIISSLSTLAKPETVEQIGLRTQRITELSTQLYKSESTLLKPFEERVRTELKNFHAQRQQGLTDLQTKHAQELVEKQAALEKPLVELQSQAEKQVAQLEKALATTERELATARGQKTSARGPLRELEIQEARAREAYANAEKGGPKKKALKELQSLSQRVAAKQTLFTEENRKLTQAIRDLESRKKSLTARSAAIKRDAKAQAKTLKETIKGQLDDLKNTQKQGVEQFKAETSALESALETRHREARARATESLQQQKAQGETVLESLKTEQKRQQELEKRRKKLQELLTRLDEKSKLPQNGNRRRALESIQRELENLTAPPAEPAPAFESNVKEERAHPSPEAQHMADPEATLAARAAEEAQGESVVPLPAEETPPAAQSVEETLPALPATIEETPLREFVSATESEVIDAALQGRDHKVILSRVAKEAQEHLTEAAIVPADDLIQKGMAMNKVEEATEALLESYPRADEGRVVKVQQGLVDNAQALAEKLTPEVQVKAGETPLTTYQRLMGLYETAKGKLHGTSSSQGQEARIAKNRATVEADEALLEKLIARRETFAAKEQPTPKALAKEIETVQKRLARNNQTFEKQLIRKGALEQEMFLLEQEMAALKKRGDLFDAPAPTPPPVVETATELAVTTGSGGRPLSAEQYMYRLVQKVDRLKQWLSSMDTETGHFAAPEVQERIAKGLKKRKEQVPTTPEQWHKALVDEVEGTFEGLREGVKMAEEGVVLDMEHPLMQKFDEAGVVLDERGIMGLVEDLQADVQRTLETQGERDKGLRQLRVCAFELGGGG